MFVSVVIEVVVVVNIIYIFIFLSRTTWTNSNKLSTNHSRGKKIKFYLNEESSQYSKGDNSEVVKTH